MNYPDDFNVPTFAAGKSVAVSRAMGVGIMAGFFIIVFLCGILIWTIRSVHVEPYILATGGVNDEWQIVRPGDGEVPEIKMTANQAVQESLVWKFANDWFTISQDAALNANMWDDSCRRTDCDTTDGSTPCKLFCVTGDDLFHRFVDNILPTYVDIADAGGYWIPIANSIRITPVGRVTDVGGTWRVQIPVSTDDNTMQIMAYAKVARNIKSHPNTMGYYVADFNAYRIK